MKKIITILFLIYTFTTSLCKAQTYHPFPTDTAQWSVLRSATTPWSSGSFTFHPSVVGDTLINGLMYKKIYSTLLEDYTFSEQQLMCFIREDTTKKLYVKYPLGSQAFSDTNEFILYDFNLAVGDTFTTKIEDILGQIQQYKFILDSIDSIATNNGYRKKLNFTFSLGLIAPFGSCYNSFYWIEGIGSYQGPFYNEKYSCYELGEGWGGSGLICFSDHDNYIIGGTNCDIVGINENQQQAFTVNAYPNPATNKITFMYQLPENINNAWLKIYNCMGVPVKELPLSNKKSLISISVSDLSEGIYFYKLCNEKQCYQGKSIVVVK